MLEGLDKIDWHSLTHAYGPADDVPELLRKLASNDKAARGNALYALYGNIWHQGTIYEATSYTVPFLIELLKASNVQSKDEILFLLAQLYSRLIYTDVDGRFIVSGSQTQESDPATMGNTSPTHLKTTRSAIYRGFDIYLRMLDDPDPKNRLYTARLLACFEEQASNILPKIVEAFRHEPVPNVRASIAMSIGILARPGSEYLQILRDLALFEKDETAKLGASLALLRLIPQQMPREAIATINRALDNLIEISQRYEWLQAWDVDELLDGLDRDSPLVGVMQQE